jgi:hypothetical protein
MLEQTVWFGFGCHMSYSRVWYGKTYPWWTFPLCWDRPVWFGYCCHMSYSRVVYGKTSILGADQFGLHIATMCFTAGFGMVRPTLGWFCFYVSSLHIAAMCLTAGFGMVRPTLGRLCLYVETDQFGLAIAAICLTAGLRMVRPTLGGFCLYVGTYELGLATAALRLPPFVIQHLQAIKRQFLHKQLIQKTPQFSKSKSRSSWNSFD